MGRRGHRREQEKGEDEVPVMPVVPVFLLAAAGSAEGRAMSNGRTSRVAVLETW